MGIEVTFVDDPDDLDQWRAAIRPNTKAFYGEVLANPKNDILDIEGISAVAHENGIPLVVDNTVPTPYLIRPLEWGADIVVHSLTKFIGGHGTSIGGAIIDGGTFDFGASGRFPNLTEPDPSYHGLPYWPALGPGAYIIKARVQLLRDLGNAVAPFNAFLFLQGLETLSLRMERHFQNADAVAKYLVVARRGGERQLRRPRDEQVARAGEEVRPRQGLRQRHRVRHQGRQRGRSEVRRRPRAAQPRRQHRRRAQPRHPSGRRRRTASSPTASRSRPASSPGLVRLSVGLESIDDIIADLDAGFRAAKES